MVTISVRTQKMNRQINVADEQPEKHNASDSLPTLSVAKTQKQESSLQSKHKNADKNTNTSFINPSPHSPHDVLVVQLFQQTDLSQCRARNSLSPQNTAPSALVTTPPEFFSYFMLGHMLQKTKCWRYQLSLLSSA